MLSVGIVGLPNVGKSTLFNALLKRQQALAANYPFATIEPNIGIVDVPDKRMGALYETVLKEYPNSLPKKIPAVCKFVDIAGLAVGAHKGEGLGNKFLSHIREVNLILHIVRDFKDENVIRAGSISPQEDISLINTELILKDLETVEKVLETSSSRARNFPDEAKKAAALEEIKAVLNSGKILYESSISETAQEIAKELALLTAKPQIVVYNTDELRLKTHLVGVLDMKICAKMESELSALTEEEQKEYLKQAGVEESGLDKIISLSYKTLGYSTFLTAGPKEVRAWQFMSGLSAQKCSGVIHTDFEKAFIAVDVVGWEDYVKEGGWKNCKDKGLIRLEGRDYAIKDGEVVIFRVNTR